MEKKPQGSPGRYSIADEGDEVPSTRIDSTTRMPAVRPGGVPLAQILPPAPRSDRKPSPDAEPAKADAPPVSGAGKKKPPAVPTRTAPMPARPAVPAAPKAPPAPKAEPKIEAKAEPKIEAKAEPKPVLEGPPSGGRIPVEGPPSVGRIPAAPPPFALEAAPGEPPASSERSPVTVRDGSAEPPATTREPAKRSSMPPRRASSRPPRAGSSHPPPRRVSSLRPPSPRLSAPPPAAFESLDLEFDEGSIAFAFDALVSDGPVGEAGKHEFDLEPVRELFAELAANHMRHVRDFMIDVKWGDVTRDWVHICIPPVRTLGRAAERLELKELTVALEKLGAELDAANAVGGQMLDAGEKERLLAAYGELVALLPQAFALDGDRTQREAVIVQALLLQVPDVRKVTIDKLHAAGLTSLAVLYEANAGDIAHVAGIPDVLAARIVERVQAYREELKNASPHDARAAEREKLAALSAELKTHHDAYEEAGRGWTSEAKARKRESFRAREEKWLEISVLLARFGEVERLQGIEKVPFSQRIAQLVEYLDEAREKYRAAEG